MKMTVIGGGNIGTLMAAEMANRGHIVDIYTSKPELWQRRIDVFDSNDNILFSGNINIATDNMKEALDGADIIWVTVPAHVFEKTSKDLLPFVKEHQIIGVVPGSGGAEFAFSPLLQKGCVLFGLQRVHCIARIKEYGKSVYALGRKIDLHLGSIPSRLNQHLSDIVSDLFAMPCISLPNYLCVTLTPSNPILHTARLYSMFNGYDGKVYYPRNFLFYEEWTDDSSSTLLACDKELQKLCDVIPLELSDVVSLKSYYEVNSIQTLTEKIHSISAFKGLKSPMISIDQNKWIPDFESRCFIADFTYGLKVILDLCELFDVAAPRMRQIWDWYVSTVPEGINHFFNLSVSKKEFISLYE